MKPFSTNMRPRTIRKIKAIQKEYKKLYEQKKYRHDYCVTVLADKYFLAEATISNYLCLELPE